MITYQVINGATALPGAQTFTPTEEGKAIAGLQGWQGFFDPKYVKEDFTLLNRVSGKEILQTSGEGTLIEEGENKFFSTNYTDAKFFRYAPDFDLNPNEFSVFFVAQPDAVTTAKPRSTIIASLNETDGVSIAFSGTRNLLQIHLRGGLENGTAIIAVDLSVEQVRNSLALYVVSFSTDKGWTVRINSKEVAVLTTDKVAKTVQTKAGEYSFMRSFGGKLGMSGIFNKDLTKAINTAELNQLENFLKQKYAIA